mmetsp:Transcript_11948/g.18912  ORF Transcript_11948/g.18912 Transcript_11948/m.18912 type:complete len:365 (-) Transcript_11948:8-1102(-)
MKFKSKTKTSTGSGQQAQDPSPSPYSPTHYRIPDEVGYFPAGSDESNALITIENVAVYQIHPLKGDDKPDEPLATGTLTLRDPAAGTADEVAIIGQVGDILCYALINDATAKISDTEFTLMLPNECIVVDLAGSGCSEDDILRVEGLLAARTKFHDKTAQIVYPDALPKDPISKAMFRTSSQISQLTLSACEMGASKIDAYGEKKKESVTETKDVKVGKATIMLAKGTRSVSKKTADVTGKISDGISNVLGGKMGKVATPKDSDTLLKKKGRGLLMASAISYGEIESGATEGYEVMVKAAQEQATSFVAKKYGEDAAELARHTAGAAANFGRAALTTKRVVNVKKMVKSSAKKRVKEVVKNAVR